MLRGVLLALALAAPLPVLAQDALVLSPDQMRSAAIAALQAGDGGTAEQFARALLARDPNDPVAHRILAELAIAMGDPTALREQATALWRSAPTVAARYEAARMGAFAATQEDRLTVAQFWLRRAMTVAPDADALRQTVSDFRAVRDRNPLSLDFGLSFSPSDNVTGGSDVDYIRVDGEIVCLEAAGICVFPMSPSAVDRAYSGWSYAPSLSLSYRLHADASGQTRAIFQAGGRGVILSDAALADLDGAEYNDEPIVNETFSSWQVRAGIEHQIARPDGSYTLSATLGRDWARGDPSENNVALGFGRVLTLSDSEALIFGVSHEWHLDADPAEADQIRDVLRIGHVRSLETGGRLRFDLSLTDARSDNYQKDFNRVGLSANLTLPPPLPGVRLDTRAGVTWTNFPTYQFFDPVPGGRSDLQVSVGADITFDRWSYAGFSPQLQLSAERTDSNINQFESEGVAVGFALVSTF